MHTTSMNVTILSALHSAKRVEQVPPLKLQHAPRFVQSIFSSLFGFFFTPRLQKLTFLLADECNKLQVLALRVQRSTDPDLIDGDMEQRDALERMKKVIVEQRAGLQTSFLAIDPDGVAMPKLHKELTSVIELLGEFYEIANELQWAMAEHDANVSARREGFVASTADELDAVLGRISAGA